MPLYTFQEVRAAFKKELKEVYAPQEIESIANLAVEFVTGNSLIDQLINSQTLISEEQQNKFEDILLRLKHNEPLQYIIGKTIFYDLTLEVNPAVLIPRQETELLVDILVKKNKLKNATSIIDIGTGSGCIAISLKKRIPDANILAVDISRVALEVAQKNALINNVEIEFIKADILDKNIKIDTKFDLIVSNPPYVREIEKKFMHANVLNFEPETALFVSDDDPLIFYEAIGKFAGQNLKHDGILAFEINEALGKEVIKICEKNGFHKNEIINDLQGKNRFVISYSE